MNKMNCDILSILKEDSRTPTKQMAVMLGKSDKEIIGAIAEMEKSGIIVKYSTIINEEKMDKESVEALIEVKVSPIYSKGFDSIAEDVYQFPEVKSVYLMSGAYDLAVFIEGRTLKEVAGFVSGKLSVMDKVVSTATHFILKKYKSEGVVLDNADTNKRLVVHP